MSYSYDEYGNAASITREISGKKFIFYFDYDTSGRMVDITYPDGEKMARSYSNGEYLSDVSWHGINEKGEYFRTPMVQYGMYKIKDGQVTNPDNIDKIYRTSADSVETEIAFDTITRRPTAVKSKYQAKDESGNVTSEKTLENLTFGYDYRGNIDTITDNMTLNTAMNPFTLTQSLSSPI